jgi:hypothetical protein
MRVVYVAGPFRAPTPWRVEQNIRRAEELALEVARCGAVPLCPHTVYRFFNGELDDQFWLDATMELLKRCDAIIVTPDWEKSSGARAEVEWMLNRRPIFASVDVLKQWLSRVGEGL